MQTLTFNTTLKKVKVTSDKPSESTILYEFDSVPTVRVGENYYEVYCEVENTNDSVKTRVPVARFPIANTNMLIVK